VDCLQHTIDTGTKWARFDETNVTIENSVTVSEDVKALGYDATGDHIQKKGGVTKLTHGTALTTITQALDVEGALTADGDISTDTDLLCSGSLHVDSTVAIKTSQVSSGVGNSRFFRDSGRSGKLSWKGVSGGITQIEL